jgi:formylglycine-generating enzyme required for sulfatase activity
MRPRSWLAVPLLAACGGSGARAPALEGGIRAGGEATRPLIVEWRSSDRAELEAASRRGLVAVRYDGRDMELLPTCVVAGRYTYGPLTPKSDKITIHDANELYAQVPVGAAKVEGALTRSGQLNVDMTVVGRFEASAMGDVTGDCTRATHVVLALTVGAFDFYAGASADAGGGADARAGGARLGMAVRLSHETLSHDGDPAACAKASPADATPPYGCGAVMRVDLVPLGAAASTGVPPAPILPAPPPPRPAAPIAYGAMAHVPAARVRLGATDLGSAALHVQELDMQPFDIDVTEVTNGAYALCVDAGQCSPPKQWPQTWSTDRKESPQLPLVGAFDDALAFCAWARKRLPTEEEWEYAARGTDFRKYPWGQEDLPASDYCRIETAFHELRMCPVGASPRDRSPFGVLDMGGSVREWVQTADGPAAYGLRGGEWQGRATTRAPEDSRAARREAGGGRHAGFRCARSASSVPPSPRAKLGLTLD